MNNYKIGIVFQIQWGRRAQHATSVIVNTGMIALTTAIMKSEKDTIVGNGSISLTLTRRSYKMSHECPDCGQVCYCGGDWDDCLFNFEEFVINCRHYLECEPMQDDYPEEE